MARVSSGFSGSSVGNGTERRQAISMVGSTTITDESLEIAQNDDTIQDSPLVGSTIITDEDPDTNNGKMLIFYCKINI